MTRFPVPGQQLADAVDGMAGEELGEDVGEIGLGIDGVQFAGFDERGEDRPVLAAAIGAGEERVLAVECERADGALDHVGVDLDTAVVEEARQARPARERVANGFGDRALQRDGSAAIGAEPAAAIS